MTAIFPTFELEPPFPGATAVYSRPNSNGQTEEVFCTKCGSRLIHRHISPEGKLSNTVSVKSGCLDGVTKEMMRSAVHIWTKSAIIDIPEGVEAYEEEPPNGSL